MAPEHRHLILHSLGLGRASRATESYRNHFVAGKDGADRRGCEALVKSGHMTRGRLPSFSCGDALFHVTEKGAQAVGASLPNN